MRLLSSRTDLAEDHQEGKEVAAIAKRTLKRPQTPTKKPDAGNHTCTCCGTTYPRQQSNFPYNPSPLYAYNNHYGTVCTQCAERLFEEYASKLKSEDEAMRRLCMKLDLYFNAEIFHSTVNSPANRSRINVYASKMGLRAHQGKTFDLTLEEEAVVAQSIEAQTKMTEAAMSEINPESVKRWGVGFTPQEYKEADGLYEAFREANPKVDGVQVTMMKDLVKTKLLMQRAFERNDADAYTKYMKAYQDMLKSSKLKLSVNDDADIDTQDTVYGNVVKMIENFSPAYLYKKQDIFEDVDGIGAYFKRFVTRPVKNFFTGSNEPDKEYHVLPDEEEDA